MQLKQAAAKASYAANPQPKRVAVNAAYAANLQPNVEAMRVVALKLNSIDCMCAACTP